MKLLTQQHSKQLVILASLILIIGSVVRVPVAKGFLRPLFQLIIETGVLVLFAVFIYFYINKWVGLFLALTLFSTICPGFGKWGYMARSGILIGCIWYTLLVLIVNDFKYLLNAICIIAIANVIFANLQYCGFDPYKIFSFGLMHSNTPHPTGLMANKNLLSALLAFSVPAFFRKWWWWFVPVIFFGLTISESTGGVVAVFIMTLVYFILKDGKLVIKKNYLKIIPLILWFCFFMFKIDPPLTIETTNEQNEHITVSSSATERFETWKTGLRLYRENRPFTGYGIGNWKVVFKKISEPKKPIMMQAHNEFVQGLFEMGVLFPVIIIGYFISIIRRYKKEAILSITAIGIIVLNSCVNFPFHVATTAIISVTWMAILEVGLRNENNRLYIKPCN